MCLFPEDRNRTSFFLLQSLFSIFRSSFLDFVFCMCTCVVCVCVSCCVSVFLNEPSNTPQLLIINDSHIRRLSQFTSTLLHYSITSNSYFFSLSPFLPHFPSSPFCYFLSSFFCRYFKCFQNMEMKCFGLSNRNRK